MNIPAKIFILATRVKRSFIRVDADEVTYPMHVILRYEIEEALINNDLILDELPFYWNQKMQEYLALIPDSDQQGCLQDIHWPMGSFGYFPAYINGAIIASMLMRSTQELYPQIGQEIVVGNFRNLNQFLNTNIRSFGSLKTTDQLLQDATKEKQINPDTFLNYLEQRYLYSID